MRAKIGSCNCTTGIADDEELERVGDVELLAPDLQVLDAGRAIVVGRMNGRSRQYHSPGAQGFSAHVWSLAVAYRCDAIVATATGADTPEVEMRVMDLLRSDAVTQWADRVLAR